VTCVNQAAKTKDNESHCDPKQGLTRNRKEQTVSPNVLHMLEAQKLGELRLAQGRRPRLVFVRKPILHRDQEEE